MAKEEHQITRTSQVALFSGEVTESKDSASLEMSGLVTPSPTIPEASKIRQQVLYALHGLPQGCAWHTCYGKRSTEHVKGLPWLTGLREITLLLRNKISRNPKKILEQRFHFLWWLQSNFSHPNHPARSAHMTYVEGIQFKPLQEQPSLVKRHFSQRLPSDNISQLLAPCYYFKTFLVLWNWQLRWCPSYFTAWRSHDRSVQDANLQQRRDSAWSHPAGSSSFRQELILALDEVQNHNPAEKLSGSQEIRIFL